MKPIVSICAMAAMMFSAVAWANPKETVPIDYPVVGFDAGNCGDFIVKADFHVYGYLRIYLNQDGSIDKVFYNEDYLNGIYYNENYPNEWLAGTTEHVQQWEHYENGEMDRFVISGPEYKVIVPGYGAVLLSVGHVIWEAPDWNLSFTAGPSIYADDDALDAICAMLRP